MFHFKITIFKLLEYVVDVILVFKEAVDVLKATFSKDIRSIDNI